MVRRTPVVHDLQGPDELTDLRAVALGVGIALDAGDVADDEAHAAVGEVGPLVRRNRLELESLRLAGLHELRRSHSVAEAKRRAFREPVEVGVLVLDVGVRRTPSHRDGRGAVEVALVLDRRHHVLVVDEPQGEPGFDLSEIVDDELVAGTCDVHAAEVDALASEDMLVSGEDGLARKVEKVPGALSGIALPGVTSGMRPVKEELRMRISVLVERVEDALDPGRVHVDRDRLLPRRDERDVVVDLDPLEEPGVVLLERLGRVNAEVDDGLAQGGQGADRLLRIPRDVADDLGIITLQLLERRLAVLAVDVDSANRRLPLLLRDLPFDLRELGRIRVPYLKALDGVRSAVLHEVAVFLLRKVARSPSVHSRTYGLRDLLSKQVFHGVLERTLAHEICG